MHETELRRRARRPPSPARAVLPGVPRAVVAQDGDVAGLVCGATASVWGGQSLRRHPPTGRKRLHLYWNALAPPTAARPRRPPPTPNAGHRTPFGPHPFFDRMSRGLKLLTGANVDESGATMTKSACLFNSEATVKPHLVHIHAKLDVSGAACTLGSAFLRFRMRLCFGRSQ